MSGNKHHYLPRFLQRPFAFRRSGKQFYVYAHHRAHGAFPTNVMKLGQELHFYGDADNSTLDDAITEGENKLGITVNRVNDGHPVSQDEMARLVSALSIRTKAMRRAFVDLVPNMLHAGRARILNESRVRMGLNETLLNPAEQRKVVDEHIRKNFPNLHREERVKKRSLLLPQYRSLLAANKDQLLREVRSQMEDLLDLVLAEAAGLANRAFLDSLSRSPEMPERAARFVEEMQFEVWEASDGEFFVLGDCGSVAMFSDGTPRLTLAAMDDNVQMDHVFLPVSPTRCVVGSRRNHSLELSAHDLNKISASLSHEFVVSHANDSSVAELTALIGTRTPIASMESIFQALNDDLDEK